MNDPFLEPLGDSARQSAALEDNVNAANYNKWLASTALPYIGKNPIEIGSGLGLYADYWLSTGMIESIALTEIEKSRLDFLKNKFLDDPRVTVETIDLREPPNRNYSSFLSFNVMEHIPDHVQALSAAKRLVSPGGYVVTWVPAFEFAMSDFDRKIGHVRRYTIKTARIAHEQAGLEVLSIRYHNFVGLFAWWFSVKVMRIEPKSGKALTIWDKFFIPVIQKLESVIRFPFGQSS